MTCDAGSAGPPADRCADPFGTGCVCNLPAGHEPGDATHACLCGGSWRWTEQAGGVAQIITFPGGIPGDDLPAARALVTSIRAAAIASGDIDLIAATMPPSPRGGIRYNFTPPQ